MGKEYSWTVEVYKTVEVYAESEEEAYEVAMADEGGPGFDLRIIQRDDLDSGEYVLYF